MKKQLKVRRKDFDIDDAELGWKGEEIWREEWLDFVRDLYYTHHNKKGESKKSIDFDLFRSQEDKNNNVILSQVLVEVVRVVERPRSSLNINKLNFKSQAVDENIYKPHIVWIVQVFDDWSKFYFESIQQLYEYRKDFRYWQEKGIFEDWIPINGKLEKMFQVPLGKIQHRIMRGENANYQSLCKRNTD